MQRGNKAAGFLTVTILFIKFIHDIKYFLALQRHTTQGLFEFSTKELSPGR